MSGQQLVSGFLGSSQYFQCMDALGKLGHPQQIIDKVMYHGVPAAGEALQRQMGAQKKPHLGLFNIFGGHAGWEFLTGGIVGIMRGDGFTGDLEDAAMGMIGGHIGEVIADRCHVNQRVVGEIAAVMTPFIVHFVMEKLSHHPLVKEAHGPSPYQDQFHQQHQWGDDGGYSGYEPQMQYQPQQDYGNQFGRGDVYLHEEGREEHHRHHHHREEF